MVGDREMGQTWVTISLTVKNRGSDGGGTPENQNAYQSNITDNYAQRIKGYIHPPKEGWYTFHIAGDDNCEFWLSSGSNPADKARIARVPEWTAKDEWGKYPEQKSNQVHLAAGGKFYFEVLHKEGGGNDFVDIGWTGPDMNAITIIAGDYLEQYQIPTFGSMQPTSGIGKTISIAPRAVLVTRNGETGRLAIHGEQMLCDLHGRRLREIRKSR